MEVQVFVWPDFHFVRTVNELSSDSNTRAFASEGAKEFTGLSVDQVAAVLEPAGFPNLFYADLGSQFFSWDVSSQPIVYAYAWGTVGATATLWLLDMFRARLGPTPTALAAAFKHLAQLALDVQLKP